MEMLVVASANKGKLGEIKEILGEKYDVRPVSEFLPCFDVEETGSTFEENAVIKARAVWEKLCVAVLSDDSGLEVDFLSGAPGIYSARYSGLGDEENNNKLLREMRGVKTAERTARFVCCAALVQKDGHVLTAYGKSEGLILEQCEGCGGFGYDSIFYSLDLKKSYGTASAEEKNSTSHRFRALKKLIELL